MACLQKAADQIKQLYPQIERREGGSRHRRDSRFGLLSIQSLKDCLIPWLQDQPTKHWATWAERIVFSTLAEAEALVMAEPS